MNKKEIKELIAMYKESDRLLRHYSAQGKRGPKGLINARKLAEQALKETGINVETLINDTVNELEKRVIIDEDVAPLIETDSPEIKPYTLHINPDGTVEKEPWSNEQKQDYLRDLV